MNWTREPLKDSGRGSGNGSKGSGGGGLGLVVRGRESAGGREQAQAGEHGLDRLNNPVMQLRRENGNGKAACQHAQQKRLEA